MKTFTCPGKPGPYSIIFLLLLLCGCGDDGPEGPSFTVDDVDIEITYEEALENNIYPSFLVALSGFASQEGGFELFEVNLTHPLDDYELTVTMNESPLNLNTNLVERYRHDQGEDESFYFEPNWDYDALLHLDQPGNVSLSWDIYIDDEYLTSVNKSIGYRSINECVYGVETADGFVDLSWMFAAYVNEDHPLVDEFLSDALNFGRELGIINSFSGYQSQDDDEVFLQVFAIWYTLQKQGVAYSSITSTSKPGDGVWSQHVRLFDEVYKNKSANCVDGSVFIASILRKIGIEPFIVLIPGHMYLGYFTYTSRALLETTAVGQITEVNLENSWNNFVLATGFQIEEYNENISKFQDPGNYEYQLFVIKDLRKQVNPIGG